VIKTRIQLKPTEYQNLLHGTVKIWRDEGANGFFRGMVPRLLRKSMSSAISWTIYEEIVRFYSVL
jgi:solute carrier family 25, member 38